MSTTVAVTAVLNAHAEGVLAGPSLASFDRTIDHARQASIEVEGLIVLDRADDATRRQFAAASARHRLIHTDEGDLGLARNRAVEAASGNYVGFLDADDLWSTNWLANAYRFCEADPRFVVAHPDVYIYFGQAREMWWHPDSRAPGFDPGFLRISNYWDSMSFAAREIYRRFPFAAKDLDAGFGYEDWHFNSATLGAGIDHRPVADTAHFKRRRKQSLSAQCDAVKALPWMTPITSYGWTRPAVTWDRDRPRGGA